MSAPRSKSMSSAWKTRTARQLSRDKARRGGRGLRGILREAGARYRRDLRQGQGGFTVDLSGATAFLPGSQPFGPSATSARSWHPAFQILGSTAAAATSSCRAGPPGGEPRRSPFGAGIEPPGRSGPSGGQEHHRLRRFVDLGGDGLLHVTDIAWQRISHPSEALQIGETVEAGHPLQPGDTAYLARHEAAAVGSVGKRRGQVPDRPAEAG